MIKTQVKILTDTDSPHSSKYNYHVCVINIDKESDDYQRIIRSIKLNKRQFKQLKSLV